MDIAFLRQNSKISEADILEFEANWKITLPPDYRAFLLKTNGGRVRDWLYVEYTNPLLGEECVDLLYFLGLKVQETHLTSIASLLRVNEMFREDAVELPKELVVIATIHDGNYYIVMSVQGENRGNIYIWPDTSVRYEDACKISDSFAELQSKLLYKEE